MNSAKASCIESQSYCYFLQCIHIEDTIGRKHAADSSLQIGYHLYLDAKNKERYDQTRYQQQQYT